MYQSGICPNHFEIVASQVAESIEEYARIVTQQYYFSPFDDKISAQMDSNGDDE